MAGPEFSPDPTVTSRVASQVAWLNTALSTALLEKPGFSELIRLCFPQLQQ